MRGLAEVSDLETEFLVELISEGGQQDIARDGGKGVVVVAVVENEMAN